MKFLHGIALMGFAMLTMNKVEASQLLEEDSISLIKITIDKKAAKKLEADEQQITEAADRYYFHPKVRYSVNQYASKIAKSKEFKALGEAIDKANKRPWNSQFKKAKRYAAQKHHVVENCYERLEARADFSHEQEVKKTGKFWIKFNNNQFNKCDGYLRDYLLGVKKLLHTRTGQNLKKKLDAVRNMQEFKNMEGALKFQAGTYQHKKMVAALKKFGEDLKTELKLSELPPKFYHSKYIEVLEDKIEIAEELLAGKIGSAYDEIFEDIEESK